MLNAKQGGACVVFSSFFLRLMVSLCGFPLKKKGSNNWLKKSYFTDEGTCLLKLQRGENVEGFS